MLPKFEIGTLVSREFAPYKADESGFYREMCKRVGQASRVKSRRLEQSRNPIPRKPFCSVVMCCAGLSTALNSVLFCSLSFHVMERKWARQERKTLSIGLLSSLEYYT